MQHEVSHPLSASQAGAARSARSGTLLTLPNARDERYPRHWSMRLVRLSASVWWPPLAIFCGYLVTTLAQNALRAAAGLTPPATTTTLGLDGILSILQEQPLLLAGALPLVAALAGLIIATRWAGEDRVREARSLLMREVSASEQANSNWMRNAFMPALDWRVRSLRRRRLITSLALLLAALVLGALLALLFSGATIPLAALPRW